MLISLKTSFLQKKVLIILIFFASCKKVSDHPPQLNSPETPEQIFTQFWTKMNYNYVFWDQDNTDWDLIYRKYAPLFRTLKDSSEDRKTSAAYFKQLTSTLIDHHLIIRFRDGPLVNSEINPALERKANAKDYHERYDYDGVAKLYLDKGYYTANGRIYNGSELKLTSGKIKNDILYFHCNVFTLKKAFDLDNQSKESQVLNFFFSALRTQLKEFKGIILDLRNNSGGDLLDLNFFGGKLISEDRVFGYSRSKDGTGKLNYLPWITARLKHDVNYNTAIPIIILSDNFTASLSEIMILALKSKSNILIGERTYGATGPLSNPDIFNSGSFDIGNFMSVRTSSAEFKDLAGISYEGTGITPDIVIPFNPEELSLGKDRQLEEAIKHLNIKLK